MSSNLKFRYLETGGRENIAGRANNGFAKRTINSSADTKSRIRFEEIPVDEIAYRPINRYSISRIERLARSIRSTNNRLINPITVMRITDISNDSDITEAVKSKGVDLTGKKYVVVAGERRLRAWKLLREEEKNSTHDTGMVRSNPFDMITANILSKEEAKNEHIFYEESNTQARHLGPEESLQLFESAISEVKSDAAKKKMLDEMKEKGFWTGKDIPDDPAQAAKIFRADKYCRYYLEDELGITGLSDTNIRKYLSIINNCCPEIKDAVYERDMSLREAGRLTGLSEEKQKELLTLWKEKDREAYEAELTKKKATDKEKATADTKFRAAVSNLVRQVEKTKELSEGGDAKLEKCSQLLSEILTILKEDS